jgi:hypothetical protein
MKKIFYSTILAIASIGMTSCLDDLNTLPLNENDFTSEKAYGSPESYKQGLAKIYGGFSLVGQEGPGEAEIAVGDAGASELIRAFWSVQELTSDAGKVAWGNDPWVREVNTNTWTTMKNDAVYAIYARTVLIVSLVNEYYKQTTDEKLNDRGTDATVKAEIQKYRAEARLIRAYAYWIGLDVFGNMPFVTENDPIGTFFPPEKTRPELFAWIESELLALTNDANLADARTNTYPRVDKGVAWGLLARLYLNAEVYTGTPRWADAKSAATHVIGSGYALAGNYAELFMSDNGENADVRKELIYAIAYDSDKSQSNGGTTFLTNAAMSGDDDGNLIGTNDKWGGIRSSYEYAQKFGVTAPNYTTGEFTCNDKRAMFLIKGKEEIVEDLYTFKQGWGVIKFSKMDSHGQATFKNFASTDFPMMRLAEMYLIYAEATLRASGGTSSNDATALGYLTALRTRALKTAETPLASYDLNYILEERARELMWEGHRRTDLIRFDKYTSGSYNWPWKGGVINGKALDSRYNLCPYPQEEIRMNKNLTPTPGYTY